MRVDELKPVSPGTVAPDFALQDILSGVTISLDELGGDVVVLNFWSGECDWSRHYDGYFAARAAKWAEEGIRLLHIKSNLNELPAMVEKQAVEHKINAPILNDEDGAVALAYGAQVTPHVYVIAGDRRIAYQGAIDDRSFRQREATVNYLDEAIEALRAARQSAPAETPAYGCAIVRERGEP